MENKKVYIVSLEMFDGEENYNEREIFEDEKDAKNFWGELIEEYREFWECFDTIEQEETSLTAYDMGWYDEGHIVIDIEQKETR